MAVTTISGNQPVSNTPELLDSTKRCDRCGAQAYVDVVLHSGLNLLFCGHHFKSYETALKPFMDSKTDQRDRLKEGNRQQGSGN